LEREKFVDTFVSLIAIFEGKEEKGRARHRPAQEGDLTVWAARFMLIRELGNGVMGVKEEGKGEGKKIAAQSLRPTS